jgi:transglutaminase-like putative cysteine protease
MRICVAHETVYRYDSPQSGVIQTLRLTPRNHAGQYVVDWRIDVSADCRLDLQEDAFGNIIHAFSTTGPIEELRLMVEGEIETQDTAGVVRGAVERFPPSLFLRETDLTRADDAMLAYAAQFPRPDPAATLGTLHDLLERIHEDIAFEAAPDAAPGAAAEAFAGKRGASRDLAHIFIAVARSLGVPARYVGGYFRRDDTEAEDVDAIAAKTVKTEAVKEAAKAAAPEAGHGWCEAHVPGLGWVGFDPTNGFCVTDQHVRVAVGLDHLGAAAVRGAHYGGGRELLAVKLAVTQASWQAQG